ncbi:MAG: isoprenylcysteine carboxylmethyltransferase family protein [Chloroflexi bacterium]|nr:isoprenylcysteine carboxylmethyltransferase family protein [Chloroflexota bacterium]MBU1748578.1 isoprenylcysteine carboxylmethyltransferase family protein [Chloroflexota bacterium]MBU1877650.1 isoprenylcysteine carboxylmethyltransferase family protein [Chloroflexota bacterium]
MKERNGEHPFGDAGQLIGLGLFLLVWVGDSFFLHLSTFLADYVPLPVRLIAAGLALVLALGLFRSGHVVISHDERPKHILTSGAFRYVRHSLYLASMLTYLALAMATMSLFSLALIAGLFVFYDFIAGYEERLLEEKFGQEYKSYKVSTGKWVPGIARKHQAPSTTTD